MTATSTTRSSRNSSADADVVLLPYDSRDQATSGVLIEAVAAGVPVVATGFPHAVELLGRGAGLIARHQDPRVDGRSDPHDPRSGGDGAADARRGAARHARLLVAAVAEQYRAIADRMVAVAA